MDAHEPTTTPDPDQEGESLDDELLPDEFPDRPIASRAFGTTEAEQARGESLRRKLAREEPDADSPSQRHRARGDDHGSVDLLTDLDEAGEDSVDTLVASRAEGERDDHRPGQSMPHSAEEAAMHIVDDAPGGRDRRAIRKQED